jgi:hypothetical protein
MSIRTSCPLGDLGEKAFNGEITTLELLQRCDEAGCGYPDCARDYRPPPNCVLLVVLMEGRIKNESTLP